MDTRNADLWAVGALLLLAMSLAGWAVGDAASEAAGTGAPAPAESSWSWRGMLRIVGLPFVGGAMEPAAAEPSAPPSMSMPA